jgi:hydrogenase maturation factor
MDCKSRLETNFKKFKRIIAIGDIHGDFDVFIKTLLLGKVINSNNDWIATDTIVVQMGDQIDSIRAEMLAEKKEVGRFSFLKINNLIKKLDKKARKKKSRIISILGNHEIMNIMGDFRYTGLNQMFETTDDINSSELEMIDDRKKFFKNNKDMIIDFACNRNVIVKVGSWLFVHGGLVLEVLKDYNLEQVNKIVSNWILGKKINPIDFKKLINFNPQSPLWNRDFGSPDIDCKYLYKTLNFINLKNMVIGHTIQSNGINSTCNQKLWRVDVGLSNRKFSEDINKIEVLEIIDDGKEINILNYGDFILYNKIINGNLKKISIKNNRIVENLINPDIEIFKNNDLKINNTKYNFLLKYKKKN